MMITVKLFGMLKTLTNQRTELVFNLKDGTQVKDLASAMEAYYPDIVELVHQRRVLISVNQEIAHWETEIKSTDEVALLPPFAGGSDFVKVREVTKCR